MNRASIEKELEALKEFYDLEVQHLFAMWVVGLFHFKAEFNDSTISEIHDHSHSLLTSGDKQLDGYFHDEDTNTLFLYQMKWPDVGNKSSVSDAKQVGIGLTQLDNDIPEASHLDTPRGAAAAALEQVKKSEGTIVLRAVTGTEWQGDYKSQILNCVPAALRPLCTVEQLGLNGLKEIVGQQSEDLAGQPVCFRMYRETEDPILDVPGNGVPGLGEAVVALLSGKSLAEQARKLGTRLFDRNVRLFMSNSKPVNKDMLEALADDSHRQRFWYGHNGITILCDKLQRENGDGTLDALRLVNPQIVNGCQTANTVAAGILPGDSKTDIPILARVIVLAGGADERAEAAELIAYGTNNQSAVRDADLRANDHAQRFFQRMLNDYSPPWFYERKTAEWKNLSKSKTARYKQKKKADRLINRDEYQQAWRSYTGDPYGAIAKKNAVWERSHSKGSGDLYKQVFDLDRRPIDVILPVTLFDWFSKLFQVKNGTSLCVAINKTLKNHVDQLSSAKMLASAHSVALFGHLVKGAFGNLSDFPEEKASKIVAGLDRKARVISAWKGKSSWKVIEKPAHAIMRAWSMYALLVEKGDSTLYKQLKSETALPELISLLENELSDLDPGQWGSLFD